MQLRSALLGLTTVILFLAGSRGAEAFLEFHPRFLGLDKIEAPLHLQLPPHMLSVTHAHKKGSNEQADDATFEAASKSQSWEEIFFYRNYLKNISNPRKFFFELGAYDGETFSNTWALEHLLGWSGILIEPGTENFAKLRKSRPDNVLINAAICGTPQVVHFVESTGVGGIVEFMSEEFMRRWHANIDRKNLTGIPPMPCIPISSILNAFGVRHIDFLSVDVEGGELQVLETIDFKQVYVYVLVVEADNTNPEKEEKIRALLRSSGFHYHGREMQNDWFVNVAPPGGGAAPVAAAASPSAPAAEGAAAAASSPQLPAPGGRRRAARR